MLQKGNMRYVNSIRAVMDTNEELRHYLVEHGQTLMRAVVTYSDSRVNPEVIFSAGLGEIFVIRTAGNIPLEGSLASIEYVIEHLDLNCVLVMGHTHCGVIDAAIHGEGHGRMKRIVNKAKAHIGEEKDERKTTIANVWSVILKCFTQRRMAVSRLSSMTLFSFFSIIDAEKMQYLLLFGNSAKAADRPAG